MLEDAGDAHLQEVAGCSFSGLFKDTGGCCVTNLFLQRNDEGVKFSLFNHLFREVSDKVSLTDFAEHGFRFFFAIGRFKRCNGLDDGVRPYFGRCAHYAKIIIVCYLEVMMRISICSVVHRGRTVTFSG